MKLNLFKQIFFIYLLILFTPLTVDASTSQVVFNIPLHNSKFRLDTRTGALDLTCKIWSTGLRPSLKGFGILRLTPGSVRQKHLSVVVKAKNSKSFNKGDKYYCNFEADGSANGSLDYQRSKMRIEGVL